MLRRCTHTGVGAVLLSAGLLLGQTVDPAKPKALCKGDFVYTDIAARAPVQGSHARRVMVHAN